MATTQCTEWRTVPGNPEIRVSSTGWIQRWEAHYKRWCLPFKPRPGKKGYSSFAFRGKAYPVHKMVALAFLGMAPSSKHTVDHINRQRDDNRIENLRYATASEQIGNRKKMRVRCDAMAVLVWPVTGNKSDAVKFDSVYKAAVELGLDDGNLAAVAKGRKRYTKGYFAAFAEHSEPDMLHPDEEFRCVRDKFYVSQYGRIKRSRGGAFAYTPRPGHGAVYASVDTNILFHRLVAEAWPDIVQGQADESKTVDHIDRNVLNNAANNLRWATHSEQTRNQSRRFQCVSTGTPADDDLVDG